MSLNPTREYCQVHNLLLVCDIWENDSWKKLLEWHCAYCKISRGTALFSTPLGCCPIFKPYISGKEAFLANSPQNTPYARRRCWRKGQHPLNGRVRPLDRLCEWYGRPYTAVSSGEGRGACSLQSSQVYHIPHRLSMMCGVVGTTATQRHLLVMYELEEQPVTKQDKTDT